MANSILQISTLLEKYNFEFPSLNERLKCILCRGILKNATQTDCGCKACDKCIKSYLSKDSKPCPNNQPECATKLNINDNIHPDHATNKEISNFEVKCPFKKCSFTSTLKNMIDHTYKCDYQEITCNKCNSKFLSIDKNRHDLELCEKRNISCTFCNKEMIFIELHTIHLNPDRDELCTKYESICPNLCSQKGKVKLKEHLVNCEKRKLECPFHAFSCDIGKLTKEAMLKHMSDAIITHSSYIVSELNDLRTNYISITNELEKQKKMTQELLTMQQISSESRLELDKIIDDFKKKSPSMTQTVDKTILHRNATYIWKFVNFDERKRDAELGIRVSVTSDPFYTSEFGYKMCLRLYPAGDGVGKGNYLSVFFAIMRGDYDDLLTWPFKQKVTLSLLDQENGSKHHCDTFKPDSRSACYQKPTDDCNIASGSPKFIPLSSITNSSAYCKNDVIYLKITVDTVGISKP